MGNKKLKVVLFSTSSYAFNGYCIVTTYLCRELAKRDDIQLISWGFQNFNLNPVHMKERELPHNVYIYDAWANESPKEMGFGFNQVPEMLQLFQPDICIIYNDMVVVSTILEKMKQIPLRTFKTIVYIDQVFLHQKAEHIKRLNEEADFVLAFTPYWMEIGKYIGINKPMDFIQHGFDPMVNYPVPKHLARQTYSLKNEDFIILNLNRNQPRKRWDTCLQAFAEVVSRLRDEPIKLLIATSPYGAWNLFEVYERELKKRGMTLQEGMKHIILIDNPQQLTDEDVNILYNVADIGINTCSGEGFGLCNFQQAAIGIPQVIPNIGGFLDFFTKERAILVEPKFTLYLDSSVDGVGGECQIGEWKDYADGIEFLYKNRKQGKEMGEKSREYILKNYGWEGIGSKLYRIIKEVAGTGSVKPNNVPLSLIQQWEKELQNVKYESQDPLQQQPPQPLPPQQQSTPSSQPSPQPSPQQPVPTVQRSITPPPPAPKSKSSSKKTKKSKKHELMEKLIERKENDEKTLLELRAKIDKLLQNKN